MYIKHSCPIMLAMGKAKKRNFYNCANSSNTVNSLPASFSRQDAIAMIISAVQANDFGNKTKDLITLFGITAEELAEAGATYEDLVALKSVFI